MRVLVLGAVLWLVAGSCSPDEPVVTAPPIAPAPVVTWAASEVTAGFARITWNVEHGTGKPFEIHRRLASKPWKNMFRLTTNVLGSMVLDDPSVQPGQTYTYRVRAAGDSTAIWQGEVTIVVPVM